MTISRPDCTLKYAAYNAKLFRQNITLGRACRKKTKHLCLVGPQEPGLFLALDSEPCVWLLRLRPRHGGDVAGEFAGCLAIPFIANGNQRFAAVLSFYLTGWSDFRLGRSAETFCCELSLVSCGSRVACDLHLAASGSPVFYSNNRFFAGNRLCL
jgi:hypothetical protein